MNENAPQVYSPQPYFQFYNGDCLPLIKTFETNQFDLAIVDPPYGIGEDGRRNHSRGGRTGFDGKKRKTIVKAKDYKPYAGNDKTAPGVEYWNELRRVSKNQICFGANHFISKMPIDSSCWLVWDKNNNGNDFADCELAWTSFNTAVRRFKWTWNGMLQENMRHKQERLHPNEKPIELYSWIIQNYAKQGDKILDTHLGSGSIAIAIDRANKLDGMNLSLTGIELDTFYFEKSMERLKVFTQQTALTF